MYKLGDLQLKESCPNPDEFGSCDCGDYPDSHDVVYDSRGGDSEELVKGVFLPHSCDHWVIGGPKEIRLLIEELQIALEQLSA